MNNLLKLVEKRLPSNYRHRIRGIFNYNLFATIYSHLNFRQFELPEVKILQFGLPKTELQIFKYRHFVWETASVYELLSLNVSLHILPLHDLWVLCAYDDIANSWKSCDVDGLLAKAKVPEEKPDDESDGMACAGCHLRRVQIGTED